MVREMEKNTFHVSLRDVGFFLNLFTLLNEGRRRNILEKICFGGVVFQKSQDGKTLFRKFGANLIEASVFYLDENN